LQRQQTWTASVVSATDSQEKSPQCRIEDREIQEFLHGTGI
jgi:serine O-acetyltransferase